jgi:hypothetical protein
MPIIIPAGSNSNLWSFFVEPNWKLSGAAACEPLERPVGNLFDAHINNDNGLVQNQPDHVQRHIQADVPE